MPWTLAPLLSLVQRKKKLSYVAARESLMHGRVMNGGHKIMRLYSCFVQLWLCRVGCMILIKLVVLYIYTSFVTQCTINSTKSNSRHEGYKTIETDYGVYFCVKWYTGNKKWQQCKYSKNDSNKLFLISCHLEML